MNKPWFLPLLLRTHDIKEPQGIKMEEEWTDLKLLEAFSETLSTDNNTEIVVATAINDAINEIEYYRQMEAAFSFPRLGILVLMSLILGAILDYGVCKIMFFL